MTVKTLGEASDTSPVASERSLSWGLPEESIARLQRFAAYTLFVGLRPDPAGSTDATFSGVTPLFQSYVSSPECMERFFFVLVTPPARQDVQSGSREAADASSGEFPAQPEGARPDFDRFAKDLFAGSAYEDFEDGMESRFSASLQEFVAQHGKLAVEAAIPLIERGSPNDAVACEALTCLSRLRDSRTHSWRRYALEVGLKSPSVFVRDAAVVGLARLGDARAIEGLHQAMAREVSPLLKDYMRHVVRELTEE